MKIGLHLRCEDREELKPSFSAEMDVMINSVRGKYGLGSGLNPANTLGQVKSCGQLDCTTRLRVHCKPIVTQQHLLLRILLLLMPCLSCYRH